MNNAKEGDLPQMTVYNGKGRQWVAVLVGIVMLVTLAGCDIRPDRMGVSNTVIDFGLNETPFPLYVWNTYSRIPIMRISAEADVEWIQVRPDMVDSFWVDDAGYDKRAIVVRINRRLLDEGEHTGHITLQALATRPRTVTVHVRMEEDGRPAGLNIERPVALYDKPYLLDFVFGLRDADNVPVIAEPGQFDVTAFEDDEPMRANETGLALRRAPPRQLYMDLALDFSLTMQETLGALQSMEDAARNAIVNMLPPGTHVGLTAFRREDRPPDIITDFTDDHPAIRQLLEETQRRHVGGFASGAILFDALMASLDKFDDGNPLRESRHVVVLTDGYDTSSEASLEDVTRRARRLFVNIHAVGIGDEPDLAVLLPLSGQTGGMYFSYRDDRDEIAPFIQYLVRNLDGQYRLRWATLKRQDKQFQPAFQLDLASNSVFFEAPRRYNPATYEGDTVRGSIRAVHHDDGLRSRVQFGADYIPRFVHDLRVYVETTHPFHIYVYEAADGGLLGTWELETTADGYGKWLYFYSDDAPLPFAGYGALFALDFGEVVTAERPALLRFDVDNRLYEDDVRFDVSIE